MVKISSGSTTFHKKVFPLLWVGFLAVFVITSLAQGDIQAGRWPFVVMPVGMTVVGYFVMKKLVWDLMDEVHDGGDFLLIRKGADEERVPLSNIMNVSASTNMNPPRVTLRLVKPGKFGSEVSFSPPRRFSFNPFAKHPVVEDLIVRVDKARRQPER
jgi:hypothetical protein